MSRTLTLAAFLAVLAGLAPGCGRGGGGDRTKPEVLDLADRAWCRGDIVRAIGVLEEAHKDKPQAFDAIYRLGVMRIENDPDQALRDLAAAAAIDPGHPGPVLFTGLIRLARNDFAGSDEDLARAYELARRRRGYSLRDTTEMARKALDDLEAERFVDAIREFTAAWAADPENGVLSFLRAEAQFEGGFTSDAFTSVESTLGKWPNLAPARTLHGEILFGRRKLDLARAEVDAALAQDPEYGPALELQGRLFLFETEHLEGAIRLWRSLLINPTLPLPHHRLGSALLRSSQPEQATAFLRYMEPLTVFQNRRLGRPTPATHAKPPASPPGSAAPH